MNRFQAPWMGKMVTLVDSPLSPGMLLGVCLATLVLGMALIFLRRVLRKTRNVTAPQLDIEKIDVSSLCDGGPSETGPHLELYHVPVRLSLLVLAPVGRDGELPDARRLPELIDQLVPGLMGVLEADQPVFHRWPPQLSSEGFTKAFFSHVNLPGDRGKGTPWCGMAGKFEADGGQYLVGLVCRSADRNSLGQVVVEHMGKWLDVLRVRS